MIRLPHEHLDLARSNGPDRRDPGGAPRVVGPVPTLQLLTWNVGTLNPLSLRLPPRHLDHVAEVIAAERPQVVCRQEVGSAERRPGVAYVLETAGSRWALEAARGRSREH